MNWSRRWEAAQSRLERGTAERSKGVHDDAFKFKHPFSTENAKPVFRFLAGPNGVSRPWASSSRRWPKLRRPLRRTVRPFAL